jgi:hypothetical protein
MASKPVTPTLFTLLTTLNALIDHRYDFYLDAVRPVPFLPRAVKFPKGVFPFVGFIQRLQ